MRSTLSIPVTVTGVPPIPHLDVWEKNMLTLATKWKSQAMVTTQPYGYEPWAWYYDGGRVYRQVADYTKDSSWLAPAINLIDGYIDYFTTLGRISPGYHVFPYGVLMEWQRTGNTKYRDFLVFASEHSVCVGVDQHWLPYIRQHPVRADDTWFPERLRESAYMADVFICYELATGQRHRLLVGDPNRGITSGSGAIYDCVIADLKAFMTPGPVAPCLYSVYLGTGATKSIDGCISNFMVGLALETLIRYYEMTVAEGAPDTNIPPFIKTVLDFFWMNCVQQPSNAQYYNSDPVNGRIDPNNPNGPPLAVNYTTSSLNQLVSPAYAWYWRHSGDVAYLSRGDALWSAGVLGAAGDDSLASKQGMDYTYMGKQFSQNYKWSPSYVAWRS